LVIVTCSGKFSVTVQPLNAVVPLLVTLTSTWKNVPPVLDGVAVQVWAAYACPPSTTLDNSTAYLIKTFIIIPSVFNMSSKICDAGISSPVFAKTHII
jgi:hypothetical protein